MDSTPRPSLPVALGEANVAECGPPERRRGARAAGSASPTPKKRAWVPLIIRVVSIGVTLLGLAGIGLAAGQTELPGLLRMASSALETKPEPSGQVWLAPSAPRERPQPQAQPCPSAAANESNAAAGAAPAVVNAAGMHAVAPAQDGAAPARAPQAPAASGVPGGLTADGKVVLNRAGIAELRRLPTVGAKRAEAIIALRERLGGFRRPSDLLRVRGIGTRTLERMLPLLVLDAPEAAPAPSAGSGAASSAP